MVLNGYKLLFFVLLTVAVSYKPCSAQDFSECQRLVKELLPVFNQSFEDNDPTLLHDETYQRTLRQLQVAFTKYNKESFLSSDSVQRMNNEAVILALSGNPYKAMHMMEDLELAGQDAYFHYNRGLFSLLSGKYQAARNDFADAPSNSQANLNMLFSYAKQKKYLEGKDFASTASGKNSGGKWNYNVGMIHKFDGNFPEAVDEISSAIRQKDDVIAYRLQRGDLLMRIGSQKKR